MQNKIWYLFSGPNSKVGRQVQHLTSVSSWYYKTAYIMVTSQSILTRSHILYK